jgi:hypothetical protein
LETTLHIRNDEKVNDSVLCSDEDFMILEKMFLSYDLNSASPQRVMNKGQGELLVIYF